MESRRRTRRHLWIVIVCCLVGTAPRDAPAQVAQVVPVAETVPSPSLGDTADDPSIWIHPTDPSRSVVFGTDKASGIGVSIWRETRCSSSPTAP